MNSHQLLLSGAVWHLRNKKYLKCSVGIATQDPELRKRLKVDSAAEGLGRFFNASTDLMKILARACGHRSLGDFSIHDLTTWKKDMADLSGVTYGGV